MAEGQSTLTVVVDAAVAAEIDAIWLYNAAAHGPDHADAYIAFLEGRIDSLAEDYDEGRAVAGRSGLRQLTMRRGRQGHGHVVIYRVTPDAVRVLHVFHTAQDIVGRLADEAVS